MDKWATWEESLRNAAQQYAKALGTSQRHPIGYGVVEATEAGMALASARARLLRVAEQAPEA